MNPSLLAILLSIASTLSIAQTNYPGSDVIGKGYNIFGEYANSKSIERYQLFDFSKMKRTANMFKHSVPKYVQVENISDHVLKTVEGSSKKEYITDLSHEMGLSGNAYFFKASIENQLGENTTQTANSFYYTYMDINTKWRVSLDDRNYDTLRHYLDRQFKIDLASLPPQELFELYGTHFITSAYLGGRIDFATTTKMNDLISETEVRTAITAKYLAIKGNAEINERSKNVLSQISTSEKLNVVGGNSEFTTNIEDYSQYLKWAEGIKNAPVLCGFESKSLKPIWLLTADKERGVKLEKYFAISILPKYPIPTFFKKDPVLDNTQLIQKFKISFDHFVIHQDCDNYILTGDEAGDFDYRIQVDVNGKEVKTFKITEHAHVWSGYRLEIDQELNISVPLIEGGGIKIRTRLREEDVLELVLLGDKTNDHKIPYSLRDLYNVQDEGTLFWEENFYYSSTCNASLYYRIDKVESITAVEFGNRGWEEFEKGNYDQCLYYSKEALKLDNALGYIHFNVALVYLIQGNPQAFEKYKLTTLLCSGNEDIKGALLDITDHETKFGDLTNSEPIKLWLESKL